MDAKAAWRERTRSWAVDLLGGSCVRCGTQVALQFDHRDEATKDFEISAGIRDGYSRARLQLELAKCQLLCEPHHREKSVEFRSVPHGGGKAGKRRCACGACKARKREYMKVYMRNRRADVM